MPLLPDPISIPSIKQMYLPQPKAPDGSTLPQEQQAWVKMDFRAVDGSDVTQGISHFTDAFGSFLTRRIVEWNFVDESGTTLPITYENVMRIGKDNITYLASQPLASVVALDDDQKKTSISISTP